MHRVRFTPSPLMGEGWGEGVDAGTICAVCEAVAPSPQPSPARGEGAKTRLFLHFELYPITSSSAPSVISVAKKLPPPHIPKDSPP